MAEYSIDKIESENLASKVMMLQRMIPANESWKLSVIRDLDGTGNLVATDSKTGNYKSVYLGLCSVIENKTGLKKRRQ